MLTVEELRASANKAWEFGAENNFAGPDPYDGLLSPMSRVLIGRLPKQLWVQFIKRMGSRTRSLLQIPPVQMSKSLALFSEGLHLIGERKRAGEVSDLLVQKGDGGPWGYEFDVQTRWAFYPAGSPNVIATTFAVRSLVAQDRASSIGPRTLEWLYSLVDKKGYFHYTPASDRLIHNGNLLAAEAVSLLGGDSGIVTSAIEATLKHQNQDGSWAYGVGQGLEWIDNFHTVYVLESLLALSKRGYDVSEQLAKGITFWREALFTTDGLPRYFNTSASVSMDVHNVATVVGALAMFPDGRYGDPLNHPALKHLLTMQRNDGSFKNGPNSVPFMRWNQAHAFRAVARWINEYEGKVDG